MPTIGGTKSWSERTVAATASAAATNAASAELPRSAPEPGRAPESGDIGLAQRFDDDRRPPQLLQPAVALVDLGPCRDRLASARPADQGGPDLAVEEIEARDAASFSAASPTSDGPGRPSSSGSRPSRRRAPAESDRLRPCRRHASGRRPATACRRHMPSRPAGARPFARPGSCGAGRAPTAATRDRTRPASGWISPSPDRPHRRGPRGASSRRARARRGPATSPAAGGCGGPPSSSRLGLPGVDQPAARNPSRIGAGHGGDYRQIVPRGRASPDCRSRRELPG